MADRKNTAGAGIAPPPTEIQMLHMALSAEMKQGFQSLRDSNQANINNDGDRTRRKIENWWSENRRLFRTPGKATTVFWLAAFAATAAWLSWLLAMQVGPANVGAAAADYPTFFAIWYVLASLICGLGAGVLTISAFVKHFE